MTGQLHKLTGRGSGILAPHAIPDELPFPSRVPLPASVVGQLPAIIIASSLLIWATTSVGCQASRMARAAIAMKMSVRICCLHCCLPEQLRLACGPFGTVAMSLVAPMPIACDALREN